MKLQTIQEKLCCPFDKSDLNLTVIAKDLQENVVEGIIQCNQCKRIYPIINGIPVMSPDEYRNFELERPVLKRWDKYIDPEKIDQFRLLNE